MLTVRPSLFQPPPACVYFPLLVGGELPAVCRSRVGGNSSLLLSQLQEVSGQRDELAAKLGLHLQGTSPILQEPPTSTGQSEKYSSCRADLTGD